MTTFENIFKAAVSRANDNRGKPGILGRVDGTVHWSTTRRDLVWVRVGEAESRQEIVAACYDVSPQRDLPVRVDNVNGVLTVVSIDQKRALEFSGNRPGFSVPAHAWLHGRNGPDPVYLEGLQFLPFLVVPADSGALAVTVRAGAYRWKNELVIFDTTTSGALTSYLPGSSAVKHFVIVCLDRDANTIVIVDGADISAAGGDALFPAPPTVTTADILAIAIDSAYLPLATVLLSYGQTAVSISDISPDLRLWGLEGNDSGAIWKELAATPDTPATGQWHVYFLSDGLYIVDDTGAETGPLGVTGAAPMTPAFAAISNSSSPGAQNIPTGTSWTTLTHFDTDGLSQNCTPAAASDKITITQAGYYEVQFTCNFKDNTGGVIWKMSQYLGAIGTGPNYIWQKTAGAGDVTSAAMSGFLNVTTVPVDIVMSANHDNGSTIALTVESSYFSVKKISG